MEASRSFPLPPPSRALDVPGDSPSPATREKGRSVPGLRPRRTIGVAVVLGVIMLQLAADVVAGRETARILARMAFMVFELPLLMIALSMAFGWSLRRQVSAGRGLLAGVGIATGFGCVFGILYGLAALKVPDLRLHMAPAAGSDGLVVVRSSLFGVLNAQMYFGLWALAVVYPFAVEGARVRDLEAQQLRSESEVTRLRTHLEPHFLLNTLNAIAGLVTDEPREARRLLVCLGDLLRDAVQETGDLQTLDKQVAWLRRYAQILEARHRGSLTFEWEIAKDCEAEMIPRLLLQPLVENAVQHGALQRTDRAGKVTVRASRKADGTLVCVVEDNGPGVPESGIRAGAFGLQAVRRRVALEAPDASLRLDSSGQGTRSIVELPRRATAS